MSEVCICGQEMYLWHVLVGPPVWLCANCDAEEED